jgi:hypothetical protein
LAGVLGDVATFAVDDRDRGGKSSTVSFETSTRIVLDGISSTGSADAGSAATTDPRVLSFVVGPRKR